MQLKNTNEVLSYVKQCKINEFTFEEVGGKIVGNFIFEVKQPAKKPEKNIKTDDKLWNLFEALSKKVNKLSSDFSRSKAQPPAVNRCCANEDISDQLNEIKTKISNLEKFQNDFNQKQIEFNTYSKWKIEELEKQNNSKKTVLNKLF
ncbi:MAG: hypothetical protein ACRC4M_00985 [Mycoplasma sp.]